MKLFYSPGACSLSPHIVAAELGIPLTLVKVDLATRKTEQGDDYLAINPKGYVPALQLDDGTLLTEGPAITQYLADLRPDAGLAPANGTIARYQLQALLGYINSELHKSFSPLFNPATPAETRADREAYLKKRFQLVDDMLARQPYLTGEGFSIADAYLFVVAGWARVVKLDLSSFRHLQQFQERVAARPAVRAAMVREKLLPA
jgi:glutathione S-transferase